MSRTYKKFPFNWPHRRPKGKKAALRDGARNKSVPPSAWDDLPVDGHCWIADKIVAALMNKGKTKDEILSHLRDKLSLSLKEAEVVYSWNDETEKGFDHEL